MALSIVNLETKGRRGWVGEDTFVDTPAKQTSALSAAQTVTLTENLSWMALSIQPYQCLLSPLSKHKGNQRNKQFPPPLCHRFLTKTNIPEQLGSLAGRTSSHLPNVIPKLTPERIQTDHSSLS